jgi:hypothetical protein
MTEWITNELTPWCSLSWETNRHSTNQKKSRILWTPKIYCRVHKSPWKPTGVCWSSYQEQLAAVLILPPTVYTTNMFQVTLFHDGPFTYCFWARDLSQLCSEKQSRSGYAMQYPWRAVGTRWLATVCITGDRFPADQENVFATEYRPVLRTLSLLQIDEGGSKAPEAWSK